MGVHDYHEGLPGYSAEQILHDGCGECETRTKESGLGLARLDHRNFARAWKRAADWNRHGVPDLSRAERPMLELLWCIQIHLENRGIEIGEVPSGF